MTAIRHFFIGIHKVFEGITVLKQERKYWKYAKVSMMLNIIFYIIIFYFLFQFLLPFLDSIFPTSANGYLSAIFSVIKWILNFLIIITTLFVSALLFNTIFFAITSPYLDGLSILAEREIYGFIPAQGKGIKHAIHGYYMSVWNGIWLNFLTIFWVVVLFPLNFIIPIFGFLPGTLTGAYFLGMSFLIYSAEHRKMTRLEFKEKINGKRMYLLGFGLMTYIILLIPFAAAILIPGGVLGGTMLYNEYFDNDDLS
jgi:CysZ protein